MLQYEIMEFICVCCDVEKGLKESSHVDVVTRVDSGRDRKSMKEESSTQYVDVFPKGRNHIPSHSHGRVLTRKGWISSPRSS